MKTKRSGTPKLCRTDQVKFEFGGHFVGQKRQKREYCEKPGNRFLQFLAKVLVTSSLNFAQNPSSLGSTTLFL